MPHHSHTAYAKITLKLFGKRSYLFQLSTVFGLVGAALLSRSSRSFCHKFQVVRHVLAFKNGRPPKPFKRDVGSGPDCRPCFCSPPGIWRKMQTRGLQSQTKYYKSGLNHNGTSTGSRVEHYSPAPSDSFGMQTSMLYSTSSTPSHIHPHGQHLPPHHRRLLHHCDGAFLIQWKDRVGSSVKHWS